MTGARRGWALVVVVAAAGWAGGTRAWAHDEMVSASDIEVNDQTVIWKVDVGLSGLAKAVKLPPEGPDLKEEDLARAKAGIAGYLASGLAVRLDGRAAQPTVGPLVPAYEPFIVTGEPMITRVGVQFSFHADKPIEHVAAHVALFSNLTSQHRAVITVRWGGQIRQIVRMGVTDLDLDRSHFDPQAWTLVRDFLPWGVHHIFLGYDHIAFLLALLLVATKISELVKIVTSFTVAHSLTLLLAAFEIVRIPGRLTEALIAASIVYVAAENLLRKQPGAHRWMLTFAFGLVHGLGFATELRHRLADLPGRIVLPVLSFNLGVEVGQLTIVLCVFPLLVLLRAGADDDTRRMRERRVVRLGSVPILLLGLVWLIDRVM